MRVAIFSDTFPPQVNGVANSAYINALMLRKLGHEVAVFTISADNTDDQLLTGGQFQVVRVSSMQLPGYADQQVTMPPFSSIFKKIQEFNPDIIHTHTPFAMGREAARAAKKLNKPLVGTHHTFFDHYLKHIKLDYPWFKKLSWRIVVAFYNQCDLVLCPSQVLADGLKNHRLRQPIQVFSNAINTELFRPATTIIPHPPTLIYMGRLSYEKSIDQILRAFVIISKHLPSARLMIVGDGPEREKLEELTRELGLADKVKFPGMLLGPDLVKQLQMADMFVTASKSENQPLSILEAMACGLPVVGVDALGVPEVVQDGVNGIIVAPDASEQFAAKTVELLQNPGLLKQFGLASRALSLNSSESAIAQKLEGLYLKLIKPI